MHLKPSSICCILLALWVSLASAQNAPTTVQIDAAGQVDGSRTFEFVHDIGNVFLNNTEQLPDNWAIDRWENTVNEHAAWFHMTTYNSEMEKLWKVDEKGDYVFVPDPKTIPALEETLRSGMKPRMVMATCNIPDPLVEGGPMLGHYGYNVRQPNDYEAWQKYIESSVQYVVDHFGRDEVRTWSWTFGVESDWQAEFIHPETGERMNRAENRREYLKVYDYFHQALVNVLGPSVYSGLYAAFEHQAPEYIEHWATGTNYATGQTGTRAAYFGVSDWYLINKDHMPDFSPFSMKGKAMREKQNNTWVAGAGIAGGLLWKYRFIEDEVEKYPALRGFQINVPEHGFFDTRGGVGQDWSLGPIDYLPADYRGAALLAIRAVAYTHAPRINWVNIRWMLGPDSFTGNPRENVRPPRFNVLRISRDMAEERLLPVNIDQPITPRGNEIRAAGTALDDGSGIYKALLVNFNYEIGGGSEETVKMAIHNLPVTEGTVEATYYRIDENHNNWWKDWVEYRKQENIEYKFSDGVTHLGKMRMPLKKYLENHLYVRVTTDNAGYQKWLKKLPEYHKRDPLHVTGTETLEVKNGTALIETELMGNSTLYVELRTPEAQTPKPRAVRLDEWKIGPGVSKADPGTLQFVMNEKTAATAEVTLEGLKKNTVYAWTLEASSPVRLVHLEARMMPGLTRENSQRWIDYDGVPQRMVLTGRSDEEGRLRLILNAPAQPWEAKDRVLIHKQALVAVPDGS